MLSTAHKVWALNEVICDEDGNELQRFEPKAYHLGMSELYL